MPPKSYLKKVFLLIGGLVSVGLLIATTVILIFHSKDVPAQTVTVPSGPAESFETDEILVQSYQLISEKRISRTVSDLTYKVSVRNTGESDKIGVSGKGESLSTTATFPATNTINFGDIAAGAVATSIDTFTIRQDRTKTFTTDQLNWQFATALKVGEIEFLEPGGRPQHESGFKIQGSNPPMGSRLGMAVEIYGNPTIVNFTLLDFGSDEISSAKLINSPPGSPEYYSEVDIPRGPFTIKIDGLNAEGTHFRWLSKQILPKALNLKVNPEKALLAKGEEINVEIHIGSSIIGAPYSIELLLPTGFSGNVGPWLVSPVANQTSKLSTTIVAPTTGNELDAYTLEVRATPTDSSLDSITSSLRIIVE